MISKIVLLDPPPAVASMIARSIRRRMAAALIEDDYPDRGTSRALSMLLRRGFAPEAVEKIGPDALRLARRVAYRRGRT